MHCHGGCDIHDVLAALGFTMADLFDDHRGATYTYNDGRTVHRSPDKRFRQSGRTNGIATTLYRLVEVKRAVAAGRTIFLVEGEKDVHAVEALGEVATTAPMGAVNLHLCDLSPLHGAQVIAIPHRDDAGLKWAQQVRASLEGKAKSLDFKLPKVGKDVADHIAAGYTINELELTTRMLDDPASAADDNQTADEAEAVKERFPRLDWHALWADQTEQEYIHNPLLPARRLVAIYSAPKIGKSLLMLEMAVTLSRGTEFLGHTPTERYRVLYVDYENDPLGDVRTRLQDMGYGPDDLDHLDYLSFPTMAALNSPRGAAELLAAIKVYSSEVVVIDTVSRAIDGEENSNDTWLEFYLHTGLQLKRLGVAMIRLDHSGKDERKGMRGGSAKAGDVDAVWLLTKLTYTKLRLECGDTRMRLDTKLLKIARCSEPLRHELEGADALTTYKAKILELVRLCDNDDLPAEANRDGVRDVAKRHGMKVATQVIAEVVKRRKADPTLPVSTSENDSENADPEGQVTSGQPT